MSSTATISSSVALLPCFVLTPQKADFMIDPILIFKAGTFPGLYTQCTGQGFTGGVSLPFSNPQFALMYDGLSSFHFVQSLIIFWLLL